jgi:hypothetical protein
MLLRPCLLAMLLALAPMAAQAQSIYGNEPTPPRGGATTSPVINAEPAAPPSRQQPGPATPAGPGPQTKPGQQPTHKPQTKGLVPPGSVIAPPGSLVLPPASVAPPTDTSRDRRRITGVTRCNQQQITCNKTCNARTRGAASNLCYKQCYSKFLHCANIANDLR